MPHGSGRERAEEGGAWETGVWENGIKVGRDEHLKKDLEKMVDDSGKAPPAKAERETASANTDTACADSGTCPSPDESAEIEHSDAQDDGDDWASAEEDEWNN